MTSSSSMLCCSWRPTCASNSRTRLGFVGQRGRRISCCMTQEGNQEHAFSFTPPPEIPETPSEWKEWEAKKVEEELAAKQVAIRRRPVTGPALHNCGPFQFKIQSDGNTPRNILEEIVWNKDSELAELKEKIPLATLQKALPSVDPPRDFIAALRGRTSETGVPALIAEVKKASPSRGVIQPDFDPVRIAKEYERGGAACLSVLTDSKYFQGSYDNLKAIRESGIKCPLLCKEFIVDAWQLYFARIKGADAVLLIAAVLPDQDIRYMTKIIKALGMSALVEVHNTMEMDRVLSIPEIRLIGINNRDLGTFEVDTNNTVKLLEGERGEAIRQRDILVVAESGLSTPEDISLVQNAGVEAVLVGESLVKQLDPASGIASLFGKDISRH